MDEDDFFIINAIKDECDLSTCLICGSCVDDELSLCNDCINRKDDLLN